MDEKKAVLVSLHPKWIELILNGRKTKEVRKRAPLLEQPFKVYLYCTKSEEAWMAGVKGKYESYKMNGKVCGEAMCESIAKCTTPFRDKVAGTCLTANEIYEYVGANDIFSALCLSNPVMYETPKELSDFGLKKAPQSWCYVKEL